MKKYHIWVNKETHTRVKRLAATKGMTMGKYMDELSKEQEFEQNKLSDDDFDRLMQEDEEMHGDLNNRSTINYKGTEVEDFDFE